ncbi:hypothetical protein [Pseudoclavibacter sp. VKM Ac-2888]|uniref:hypothetical protein n=1 Tax=Pseudoclavibacter sp. VKM Ac-2888 TaxID=2783830 RepID=UPI001889F0F9|nr:hypothetical protein [Pseudoclavibacter sp. VKM Ac-2888]MBF4548683.1 hypothetical protein [Pseudoclavibacter sp. VKM Ac-2888]
MNVDDETLKHLRTLDVAPHTSLTDAQREVAAVRKASILATDPTDREGAAAGACAAGAGAGALQAPSRRSRRSRTRRRLAWGIGIVAVTGAAVAALVVAATTYLGNPAPVVGTTPIATTSPSPLEASAQPRLTEAEAIAGCVDAWRPDPDVQSTEQYESFYVNDKSITNVVDGEWQITLVPTQQIEAEWNLYCTSSDDLVIIYTNGYDDWPTIDETQTTTIGETVLLAASEAPETIMEARIGGTLGLNEGGCWVVVENDYETLLQFPFGSTLTQDGRGVDVPGVGVVGEGDTIGGSGGIDSAPPETPAICGGPAQVMAFWQAAS